MEDIYLWIIAVFIAFFVKGVCGFANTLVFSSILSFGTPNINISPVDLLIGIPSNAILVFKNRKKIDPKVCVPLSIIVALGVIPGALFLRNVDVSFLKIVFGIVVIIVGIEFLLQELLFKKSEDCKPNKLVLLLLGLISGVMCGLFGVGAMLASYVNSVAKDSDSFKANMCIVFLVDNIIRLVIYSVLHIFTVESFKISAILIAPMILGLYLGMLLSSRINAKLLKIIVIVMLIISGIALILNTIL